MGAEQGQAEWLKRVRQEGERIGAQSLPPPERATQFLMAVADGEYLHAALLWHVDADRRLQLATNAGISRLTPGGGKLTLDALHIDELRETLGSGQPSFGLWNAPNGRIFARARAAIQDPALPPLVIELFFPTSADENHSAMHLAMDELLAVLVRLLSGRAAISAPTAPTEFWQLFDQFTLSLQRSLSVADVAAVAANDGRVLLDCDRLSIALKHGPRARIASTSGQEAIQHRANLIARMGILANVVMKLGEPVVYQGTVDGFPPEFAEPLSEYLAESRSRMIMLVPFRENIPHHRTEQDLADQRRLASGRVVGCLIVEQSTETVPKPTIHERLPLVTDHVAAAISNARDHEQIFLLPVWRTIGRTLGWFRGRRLAIGLGILAACVVVGFALAMVPWEYRVEATGRAMPAEQFDIFAPWDGHVTKVLVENGQEVKVGTTLLVMRSDDLDTEWLAAENAVKEKVKQADSLREQRDRASSRGEKDEALRIVGELRKTEVEREGAELRAKKFRERREALTVKSPVDGVVATFQARQNLLDRPVKRGDLLVEVMNEVGPWRLELDVPEYRMGHVLRAVAARPGEKLDVDYIAATAVSQTHQGKLSAIGSRSDQSEEEGTVVECHVDINADDLPGRRIGADVTAKIHCGKRSLGYVLFGDVVEFLQRKIWW
jgi:hypothetical protein